MLLIQSLRDERRHGHAAPELIPAQAARPARAWRVTMVCGQAGSPLGAAFGPPVTLTHCGDGGSLYEAIRRAELAAHWRGLVVRAITYAGEMTE